MATEVLSIEVREDGSRIVKRKIDDVGRAAQAAHVKTQGFKGELKKLGQQVGPINALKNAMAGLGGAFALGAIIGQATKFESKIAEISTLVDTTTFRMDKLTDAIKEQAIAFGSDPIQQGAAAYDIISAGALTASEAIERLTSANKLAVGGVTDVATAADGLTSVLNVYREEISSAEEVTDSLFVAMKAGKTTIGELSSNIGKVAPLAQKTGVSFDELTASIAAITKGGVSTAEAVTGVKAILAAVVRPTKEAADQALKLGIQFDVAAIKSKGLAGFLEDVRIKTKGSTEEIAKLFSGQEALIPVLGLTGAGAKDLADILEQMEVKAGATEEAFAKIAETSEFKLNKAFALLKIVSIEIGATLTTVLSPILEILVTRFDDLARAAGVFLTVFAVSKIGAIATAMKAAAGSVILFNAALLANPVVALAVAITSVVAALAFFIDDIKVTEDGVVTLGDVFQAVFNKIKDAFKSVISFLSDGWSIITDAYEEFTDQLGSDPFAELKIVFSDLLTIAGNVLNSIAGFVEGSFNAIAIIWNGLDTILESPFSSLVNVVIGVMNQVTEVVVDALNFITRFSNEVFGTSFGEIKPIRVEFVGDTAELFKAAGDAFADGLGQTRVTDLLTANVEGAKQLLQGLISDARKIAEERNANIDVGDGAGTAAGTGGGATPTSAPLTASQELEKAQELLGAQSALLEGTAEFNAERIRLEQETLATIELLRAEGLISEETRGQLESKLKFQSAEEALGAQAFLLEGTAEFDSLKISQEEETLNTIDELRERNFISEKTRLELLAKIDEEKSTEKLKVASKFFGDLSSLSASGNKRLAAIGKAAAISQATIDGILGVQKALGSAPPPLNFVLAAAVGVAAAANVASIASRRHGGDLNQGQVSRVGEDNRPELFIGASGKQFMIPPERGRVEPIRGSKTVQSSGGSASPIGIELTTRVEEDEQEFANILVETFSTPRIEKEVLAIIERNPESLRNYLN